MLRRYRQNLILDWLIPFFEKRKVEQSKQESIKEVCCFINEHRDFIDLLKVEHLFLNNSLVTDSIKYAKPIEHVLKCFILIHDLIHDKSIVQFSEEKLQTKLNIYHLRQAICHLTPIQLKALRTAILISSIMSKIEAEAILENSAVIVNHTRKSDFVHESKISYQLILIIKKLPREEMLQIINLIMSMIDSKCHMGSLLCMEGGPFAFKSLIQYSPKAIKMWTIYWQVMSLGPMIFGRVTAEDMWYSHVISDKALVFQSAVNQYFEHMISNDHQLIYQNYLMTLSYYYDVSDQIEQNIKNDSIQISTLMQIQQGEEFNQLLNIYMSNKDNYIEFSWAMKYLREARDIPTLSFLSIFVTQVKFYLMKHCQSWQEAVNHTLLVCGHLISSALKQYCSMHEKNNFTQLSFINFCSEQSIAGIFSFYFNSPQNFFEYQVNINDNHEVENSFISFDSSLQVNKNKLCCVIS